MVSSVDSAASRPHRAPTQQVADATAGQTQKGVPQPSETPQRDWTATAVDPAQKAAARQKHASGVPNASAEQVRRANEAAEMSLIGGKNKPAVLVDQGGNARKGTTITIHGINDNPASVLPLGDHAARTGEARKTLAWDDRARRLGDSADDLAREVKGVLDANPKAPVTINAYSMGGRVATVALSRLEESGALKGRDVRLNLVAPPLQGYGSANMAGMGALFSSSLRSSQDMGTRSAFQKELEGAQLKGVKVRVYGGAADSTAVVDAKWNEIARKLAGGAAPVILPGATHESAVDAAAKRLR